jgi:hypothetical protein
MTHILDSIASFWFYIMFVSFLLGIIGFGILFSLQQRVLINFRKNLKLGGFLLGQVFLIFLIGLGIVSLIEIRAKNELQIILDTQNIKIIIDGKVLENGSRKEIIEILSTVERVSAHHSHPTKEIIIELEYIDQFSKIYLNKDSEIENEYWVFWDKYELTQNNEIGRITSSKIKDYGG